MKYFTILIFFIYLPNINAQCIVDAGNDIYLCVDKFGFVINTPLLNAKINLGTPPYKTKWKSGSSIQDIIFSNDSILNPQITSYQGLWNNGKKLTILISILDSNGNNCKDSLVCMLSQFGLLQDITTKTIKLGDTFQISPLVGGGIGKKSYSWSPNYNIVDSTIAEPKVWPRINTIYYSTVIDSLGCISSWNVSWRILIDSTSSFKAPTEENNIFLNYHNPIYENSIFEINNLNEIENIEIYNSGSQKLYSKPADINLDIGKIASIKGTYYLVIQYKNKNKESIKIIRE